MLSPTRPQQKFGHVSLDKSHRPGLVRALVICKFPKLREEIVNAMQIGFEVDYYTDAHAAISGLMAQKVPGLIVMDYEIVTSGSRDFMRLKMESEHLHDIPILITGRVTREEFNETVRMICPITYLRRPFMKSALTDEANKLVDRPLELSWQKLPLRRKEALQGSAANFRNLGHYVKRGNPIRVMQTKESCLPIMEEVLDGYAGELISNVKGHHNHTYVHSLKVSTLLSLLGNAIGIKGHELLTVAAGGMLIDIGKMALPQDLVNSPEELSKKEMETLKKHVHFSSDVLDKSDGVSEGIRVIAEQHHEKLDGSGYPKGLTGRDLNELARLATIIDIFCALTDERTYKPGYTCDTAIKVLERMKGQLDPFLLALFKEIVMEVYRPRNSSVH